MHVGIIKSWNPIKGWGFIDCKETFEQYGKDIFVMKTGLPNGYATAGESVTFTVAEGKKGPEATCVGSGDDQQQSYVGSIKSFVPLKGWGLIECQATHEEFGKDMFVLKTQLPNGHADKGDRVRFCVVQGTKGPEAANVQFTGSQQKWGGPGAYGASRGPIVPQQWGFMQGPHHGKGGAPIVGAGLPQRALQGHHSGVVKSFAAEKGWGFITPSSLQFGKDLFVMKSGLAQEISLTPGEQVQFKVQMGKKGLEAFEVHVVPNLEELSGSSYTGLVKSYNAEKGWGFIESDVAQKMFGRDIFFHKRDLGDHTPTVGEQVEFSDGQNNKGAPQAESLNFATLGGFQVTTRVAKSRGKPY